jgi:Zn-dependent oligopeptidase
MSNEYCNGRKNGHDGPKEEPGEWAGEGYCKSPAGRGTPHVGRGRCKHHDGKPPEHGLYAKEISDQIKAKYEDAKNTDIESMADELAMMRATVKNAVEKMEDSEIAEHAPKIIDMLDKVSRNVERLHKILYGEKHTVRIEEIDVIVGVIIKTVDEVYDETDTSEELLDELESAIQRATGADHRDEGVPQVTS